MVSNLTHDEFLFLLGCALSFVSGRGLPELVGTVVVVPKPHGPSEAEVKLRVSNRSK